MAIPFSFFDVENDRFATVHSTSIPIEVGEAQRMAEAEIVAGSPRSAGQDFELQAGGIFANIVDPNAMRNRAEEVLLGLDVRCNAESRLSSSVEGGGLNRDTQALVSELPGACEVFDVDRHVILIDENGYFEDIQMRGGGDVDPELVQCMREVLDGLSFPCLADTELSYYISMIV